MDGRAVDGDDKESRKFRNGRDSEVLGGVDLLRPRAGLGVEQVEGDVAVLLVPLAQPEDDHGVAASSTCSAASTPDAEIQRERGGI